MIPSFEQRHSRGGRALACFGGDSSSSSTNTTQQTDNRRTLGQGAISAESGAFVNVQTADADVAKTAITATGQDLRLALNANQHVTDSAFDFGNNQTQRAFDAVSSAFDFGRKAQSQAYDSLQAEASLVSNAYADAKGRGALTDKILIGTIIAMAVVATVALRGHHA